MEFELVISNPPYGKIGANITKDIIDYVDYEEFINLLPANDYKRNDTADLYNYQSDMEAISGGFDDAAIITTVAIIHKTKVNNMTLTEYEINAFTRSILDKYFYENLNRTTYETRCNIPTGPINFNILIPTRTSSGDHSGEHHLAYSRKAAAYLINTGVTTTYEEAAGASKYLGGCSIIIPTQLEHDNIVNFMYSKDGFRFISKLFTTMHKDTLTEITYWFPKVDWTRSWTVEEILADYGYTEAEIKEVMEDLKNYKGMND